MEEVNNNRKLDHKNIVRCLEWREEAKFYRPGKPEKTVAYVVQEYVHGSDLFDCIAKDVGAFDEPTCRYFFKQLLEAIFYMHSHGVAHRDFKLENIMLDEKRQLKVIDLGFSIPTAGRDNTAIARSFKGTLAYMPPEVHARQGYFPTEHDMFGAAVILFLMRSGAFPFYKAVREDALYSMIINWRSEKFW